MSCYFAHHGGTQWPGYHVFEQVLQQFVLFVQLRAREEDIHQDQAQLVGGLSEEEFGDPQWPVWHQRATDRVGADAGHCPPWTLCYGGEPVVVHHMPYDHPVVVDDVVHLDQGQEERAPDGERCARHDLLDKR